MIGPDIGTLSLLGGADGRSAVTSSKPVTEEAIRKVALEFESIFLAEMLKHTGVGKPQEAFGGGAGEAAFSGMLTQEYANQLAANGGVGLADRIASDLARRAGVSIEQGDR